MCIFSFPFAIRQCRFQNVKIMSNHISEQMSLRGDVYVFVQWDQPVTDTVSLHDVLSLSGKHMPEETLHLSPVDCQKSVMCLSEWDGICPAHVNLSFFFEWMPLHQWIGREPSNNIWVTPTVITTATCTALPCRCNDGVPLETRGWNDSALHFSLDFCIFLPHYKVDLPWSPRGLKLLSRSLCVILKEQLKAKDCWLLIQLVNALLTKCHFRLEGTGWNRNLCVHFSL